MRFIVSLIILPAILLITGCAEVLSQIAHSGHQGERGLTSEEIIRGLKEALIVGAGNTAKATSKTDDFYKNDLIWRPVPQEAVKVKTTLEDIGLGSLTRDFEQALNRAAEEASKRALPIFKDAVMNMTISDGMSILRGDDNAATEYLRKSTSDALTAEFSPVVQRAVQAVEVTKYWNPIVSAYNRTTLLTGERAVNPDLDKYITEKTLEGLFRMIEIEEKKIRKDPVARVTDILKRVFGSVS